MFRFLMLHIVFHVALTKAVDERPVIRLPAEINDLVAKSAFRCMVSVGVSSEVVKRFFTLHFDDDENSKRFLFCVCYRTYFADEYGHLTEDLMDLFRFTEFFDDVRKVFDECNKVKTKDPVHTIYKVVQCFHKNSPVVIREPI